MSKKIAYEVHTIGRRKSSVARIFLAQGTGEITVNKRKFDDYFPLATSRLVVSQPLDLLNLSEKYDLFITVKGGGLTGQAGAIRLGIARALLQCDATHRKELKAAGFLMRDARKVERKKYGQRGARANFQFSKR